jgi:hypothetical protein
VDGALVEPAATGSSTGPVFVTGPASPLPVEGPSARPPLGSRSHMVRNMPEVGSSVRDVRIDFFRGIALYMIIFDHIPDDPLSKFTYARLGFSDAAEIFVFLSGVSCGIVYSRILQRQSTGGLLKAVSRRTLQIYLYYLIASFVTILLITLSRDVVTIPANHQAFIALREAPPNAILSAILLVSPPELPGILVLYLELTFFVIPSFLLIAAHNRVLALALSGSIWIFSQIYPELLPRLADHSYFNPLAWQFLFCIGIFVGASYQDKAALLDRFRTPGWKLLAWSLVGIGLAYKITIVLSHNLSPEIHTSSVDLVLADATLLHMKENLSAIRLSHFLSVAFLVSTCVKVDNPILGRASARAVIDSGKCSLQVFCLGAVLSVALNLFVAVDEPFVFERLILDCAAIVLIALIATALVRSQPVRGTRKAGSQAPREAERQEETPRQMVEIAQWLGPTRIHPLSSSPSNHARSEQGGIT